MFAVLALAGPPVLARDAVRLGLDAGLSRLHVAEDLDCINGAALIGINPVLSCRKKTPNKTHQLQGLYILSLCIKIIANVLYNVMEYGVILISPNRI